MTGDHLGHGGRLDFPEDGLFYRIPPGIPSHLATECLCQGLATGDQDKPRNEADGIRSEGEELYTEEEESPLVGVGQSQLKSLLGKKHVRDYGNNRSKRVNQEVYESVDKQLDFSTASPSRSAPFGKLQP